MLKITDKDYRLPHIEALLSTRVFSSGTTQPMLLSGVDILTTVKSQYVVKFINSPRMDNQASCRELIGAWIARELDLKAVEPVVINISQAFVDTIVGQDGYNHARNSIGLNFGSIYVEGFEIYMNSKHHFTNELWNEAKNIFAFDMFISNADRGAGKPNVLTDGSRFLLFDHELGFSFTRLLPMLRSKSPWILGDAEKEMYQKHYFYPYLRDSQIDFDEFTERFSRINNTFWERVDVFLPKAWRTEELDQIKFHLQAITENRKTFSEQLTKVLTI